MSETYEGWSNYETWAVKLWIDNDFTAYNHWQEVLRKLNRNERATAHLADRLRDEIAGARPPMPPGLYADMLTAALDAVNWAEIAADLMEA